MRHGNSIPWSQASTYMEARTDRGHTTLYGEELPTSPGHPRNRYRKDTDYRVRVLGDRLKPL